MVLNQIQDQRQNFSFKLNLKRKLRPRFGFELKLFDPGFN